MIWRMYLVDCKLSTEKKKKNYLKLQPKVIEKNQLRFSKNNPNHCSNSGKKRQTDKRDISGAKKPEKKSQKSLVRQ